MPADTESFTLTYRYERHREGKADSTGFRPRREINIIDLGLVYVVDVQESEGKTNVRIEMTMTSPACPAGPQLIANSKDVVSRLEGVSDVEVRIVLDPPWTPDRMTEEAKDMLGIF